MDFFSHLFVFGLEFFIVFSWAWPPQSVLSKTKLVFSFQLSYYFVMFLAWSWPLENIWIQVKRTVVIFRKVLHDYSASQVRCSRCLHSIGKSPDFLSMHVASSSTAISRKVVGKSARDNPVRY